MNFEDFKCLKKANKTLVVISDLMKLLCLKCLISVEKNMGTYENMSGKSIGARLLKVIRYRFFSNDTWYYFNIHRYAESIFTC